MTTNRREVETDEDACIARGDMIGARAAYLSARAQTQEAAALYSFFKAHAADVLNCEANAGLLSKAARALGGPVTEQLLEVVFLNPAVRSSLIAPNPPERIPTPEENRVSENRRLVALTSEQLRQEIARQKPHLKIMTDTLSPEVAALKTRADIKALSADLMRGMMNFTDGRKRHKNIAHIESVLNGTI
jgi:hypothetical protein